MSTSFLDAALKYAAAGIPVFPCEADGKQPVCAHGHKDATTNVEQITAWWAANPNYNLALCPEDAGWCVVDIDPGAERPDYPMTYEVKTPRGGAHLYYKGSLPPTVNKLGKNIDTRGRNSYVLVAPSIVNGKPYQVLHDRPIENLPAAIAASVATANQPAKASYEELDGHSNVARARSLLADCVKREDVAVTGQGGNSRTYRLAAEVQALGLSPSACLLHLEELWNPHCRPPWDHDELARIVENANQYMQNEAGANAVAPAQEVFGSALETLPDTPEPDKRSRFYFEDDEEQDLAPDPEWLIPELIPDRATVLVLGLTGSFKSFLVQDIAMSIATGLPTFGTKPKRIGPTFYGAHEVRDDIRKSRKHSWKVAKEVAAKIPFYVARGPHVISSEECEEFREQIRVRLRQGSTKIGVIVLDTVAKCMVGLNENDAGDVGRFIAFVDSLRDEFECAVICLHHFGKDEGRGGRGSSAFQAGFDTTLGVKRVPNTKLVSVKVIQHASAPEREDPFFFEGVAVGQSLVFQPMTASEHKAASGGDDHFAAKKIGAALGSLGARGIPHGVSTIVLASSLIPPDELDTPEEHQALIEKAARALATLSRTKLEAYCTKQGHSLVWHLPD